MSTVQNDSDAAPINPLERVPETNTQLVLIALGGVILAVPASAQSAEAANTKTGSILGTVVD